jgi:hypothetical protein
MNGSKVIGQLPKTIIFRFVKYVKQTVLDQICYIYEIPLHRTISQQHNYSRIFEARFDSLFVYCFRQNHNLSNGNNCTDWLMDYI